MGERQRSKDTRLPRALLGALAVAMGLHAGGLLGLYLRLPRPGPPRVVELEALALAPAPVAPAQDLVGTNDPLPGEEALVPILAAAEAPEPPPVAPPTRRPAPAVPALSDPVDSPTDDRVRVPAAVRAPVIPSASGEVFPDSTGKAPGDSAAVLTGEGFPASPVPAVTVAPVELAVPEPRPDGGVSPAPAVAVSERPDGGALGNGRKVAETVREAALALFNARMTERVRAEWHPSEVYRQVNPKLEGNIGTGGTTIEVRLRADGSLERAKIIELSGTPALDGEALAALQRAQPFSPPPPELLDAAGGLSFPFRFGFDLTVAAFIKQLHGRIRENWKPSPAFRRFGGWGEDRTTVVRILLRDDGTLVHAAVVSGSGVDLLDNRSLSSLKVGSRLLAPPPEMRRPGSLCAVRVVFIHSLRGPDLIRVERERTRPLGNR